jgi:hypothetical protein
MAPSDLLALAAEVSPERKRKRSNNPAYEPVEGSVKRRSETMSRWPRKT